MGFFGDFLSFFRSSKKKKDEPTKKEQSPQDDSIAKAYEEGVVSLVDILSPSGAKLTSRYLEIDGKFTTTLFAATYPRYLDANWFSPIVNFDVEFDIAMYIYPQDSAAILKQLRKRVTQVSASMSILQEGGKVRDPQLATAYQDIEELRDRLVQGTERFFQYGLYITLYANSEDELDNTLSQVEVLMEGRLVYTKRALYRMDQGWNSTLPLGQDRLVSNVNMNTSPLSTSFPFVSSDLTSNSGVLYGVNLHNNSLVLFDRFSLENANMVIFAKSGAGKSIRGDEPVLVREQGTVSLRPIQEIVDNLISERGITYRDDELEGVALPDIEVFSFNSEMKGEWSPVSVAARKDAPETFYKFTTRSGREVTTTGDHNMVVLRDGKVEVVKSTEVAEGEFLPLPRTVEYGEGPEVSELNLLEVMRDRSEGVYVRGTNGLVEEHYAQLAAAGVDERLDRYLYKYRQGRAMPLTYFWKMLELLDKTIDDVDLAPLRVCAKNGPGEGVPAVMPLTAGWFRLLGYIVAEGTIKENLVIISNLDRGLLEDAGETLRTLGIPFYFTDKALVCASRVFVNLLQALGCVGKSATKQVPSLVWSSDKRLQAAFLQGYFEGDGGVERSSVTVTSKSKQLMSEISYLLYGFGIVSRLAEIQKEAVGERWQEKRPYWKCTLSGQDALERFMAEIGFFSERKQQALAAILGKQANTNVDLVPELQEIFAELHDLLGFQLQGMPDISAWRRGARVPSRTSLQAAVESIQGKVERFERLGQNWQALQGLPALEQMVAAGQADRRLNKQLWSRLGQSWRVAKSGDYDVRCRSALAMIEETRGQKYELAALKQMIHAAFGELGLSIKEQPGHLQSALVARPESNTSYTTIHSAAQTVWSQYAKVCEQALPRVKELLTQLKRLSESDLFWDEIVQAEKIANTEDKYVYDLTVENEVFLAGHGGMYVHNSYTVKLEILRSMMMGTEVLVIDPEQEYRYLAEAVGGSYLKIAIASDHRVNPFDIPELQEDENPDAVLRENITRLIGLIGLMADGMTPEEQSIVDRALWETYALKDITANARWKNPEMPTLQDFYNITKDMEGGKNVAIRLERFVTGTFAGVFNRPSNIDLDKQLVVFNLRDMEEELRPIAMYVVLGFIWNRVRSSLKRRLLTVDEAWIMMQHEESAKFLFSMAKRARKYYLGVTTITQDISDFLGSKYGKPIVTNSSIQLLLRQSPAAIDLLGEVFYLTDHEKFRLLESDVGEGIFFAGVKHVAIKVIASYAEDQVITSDPQQILAIEAAKREVS